MSGMRNLGGLSRRGDTRICSRRNCTGTPLPGRSCTKLPDCRLSGLDQLLPFFRNPVITKSPPICSQVSSSIMTMPLPSQAFFPSQALCAVLQSLLPLHALTPMQAPSLLSAAEAVIGAVANKVAAAAASARPVIRLLVIIGNLLKKRIGYG